MKVIDLSHPIARDMPVYPGTELPDFHPTATVEADGFAETRIAMTTHAGTHVDSPAHILVGGATLDRYPPEHFFGEACCLRVSGQPGGIIELAELKPHRALVRDSDFVLLATGWSRYWGTGRYYEGFPLLSAEAAEWLAGFTPRGIGTDTPSVDAVDSTDFPLHKIFLGRDILLVENLTNLAALPPVEFQFNCLPLKIGNAEASPVRAVGVVG